MQNRRGGIGLKRRFGLTEGRGLVDDIGDQLALKGQAVLTGLDLTLARLIENQSPADKNGQAQQIENDDQAAQARAQWPAALAAFSPMGGLTV